MAAAAGSSESADKIKNIVKEIVLDELKADLGDKEMGLRFIMGAGKLERKDDLFSKTIFATATHLKESLGKMTAEEIAESFTDDDLELATKVHDLLHKSLDDLIKFAFDPESQTDAEIIFTSIIEHFGTDIFNIDDILDCFMKAVTHSEEGGESIMSKVFSSDSAVLSSSIIEYIDTNELYASSPLKECFQIENEDTEFLWTLFTLWIQFDVNGLRNKYHGKIGDLLNTKTENEESSGGKRRRRRRSNKRKSQKKHKMYSKRRSKTTKRRSKTTKRRSKTTKRRKRKST